MQQRIKNLRVTYKENVGEFMPKKVIYTREEIIEKGAVKKENKKE